MRTAATLVALTLLPGVLAGCLAAPERDPPPGCGTTSGGAPDLCGQDTWLNSDGESLESLQGQVVIIDFWTYSCINCIRTFPHLTAWYDAYHDLGLEIIGVHAPEFDFEKDLDNVEAAIADHGLRHPVVLDNDYRIWNNYDNRYWPAKYVLGPDGGVVYSHFGEGAYEETEEVLRTLLLEAGAAALPPPVEPLMDEGVYQPDITRELYAGTWRQADALGNQEGYRPGQVVDYSAGDAPARDRIYLDGAWHNGEEALESIGAGSILLRFRAGAVNFVVGPAEAACLPITLDGAPVPEANRTADILGRDGGTCVDVAREDSYDLYAGRVGEHVLRIDVPDGLMLYTFAFGGRDA